MGASSFSPSAVSMLSETATSRMSWSGEKFFCQPSDLYIVSAQTGKVFDEHSSGFSLFKLLHHFNETGTVHGHAGNAIIQKVNQIGIAFFPLQLW